MRFSEIAKMPPILFFTSHCIHTLRHVAWQLLALGGGSVCLRIESWLDCDLLRP